MSNRIQECSRPPEGPGLPARILDRALGMETLLTVALLGGFALLRLRSPIGDPDLGWHLAAGRGILDSLGLPDVDTFSYVAEGRPWIAYSWLAEAFFAACERFAGPGALVVVAAALISGTFAFVLRTCRVLGARHVIAVLATFLGALVSAPTWTVRPHLFSFLLMAIFCHVLVLDRRHAPADHDRSVRHLWILIPTTVLWANTHLFFVFGVAVLGLDALCRPHVWLWDPSHRRIRRGRCGVLLAVGAATLVNPHGWHLLLHLVELASDEVAFTMVRELQTPSLHHLHGQLLTLLFFSTAVALTVSPARKEPCELATVFVFAFLAYSMARNMAFFAIVAAPVLARHMDALLPAPALPDPGPLSTVRRGAHAVLLATCGIVFTLGLRGTPVQSPETAFNPSRYPVAAVGFLNAQPALGRLFNHFNWGGYLIDHLYPRYQVSIDGRTGVYGNEHLRRYRATQYLQADWRVFFDRCDPDVVLWPKDDPFVRAVELLPEWRRLYEDEIAVIFVRERPRPPHLRDAAQHGDTRDRSPGDTGASGVHA